jgi:hypothetical protein
MTDNSVFEIAPTLASVGRRLDDNHRQNPVNKENYQTAIGIFQQMAGHTNRKQIYLKVVTINTIFTTRVFDAFGMARHIQEDIQQLDGRLARGDVSLVHDIMQMTFKSGKTMDFYSFASKYCHCQQPDLFPISDQYVLVSLKGYQRIHRYWKGDWRVQRLTKEYTYFREVVLGFRESFGLGELTLAELDRYLWLMGLQAKGKLAFPPAAAVKICSAKQ